MHFHCCPDCLVQRTSPRSGNQRPIPLRQTGRPKRGTQGMAGFTLLELLVVIGIIGILTAISLPSLKGLGQANITVAAHRQIMDDINFARLRALNDRSTVYIVFVSDRVRTLLAQPGGIFEPSDLRRLRNLVPGQYNAYAIVSMRTVGDQPGQPTPRYLTGWRQLPDGMIFAPSKFDERVVMREHPDPYRRSFALESVPFPSAQGPWNQPGLPVIGFNSRGQLLSGRDEVLPLVRGNLFIPTDNQGAYLLNQPADVQTIPPQPRPNDYHYVRINWLTGRPQVELPQFTP